MEMTMMNTAPVALEEWRQARKTGIGGSDAAAVLGLSKWKSPYQVYLDKISDTAYQEDNEAMLWGRELEPVIRAQYASRTGQTVMVPNQILRHPQHQYMLANLDGITTDRKRVVEIKTSRFGDGFGDAGTDQVPVEYLLQCQHYLTVTGAEVADVAVLIGGSDFRIYEIPADHELQEMLVEREEAFWQCVVNTTPPPPASISDILTRFRFSKDAAIEANQECLEAIEKLARLQANMKQMEEEEEKLKVLLFNFLGEHDTLVSKGKVLLTWKTTKPSNKFNEAAFKAAYPELHAQFISAGNPYRRLLLKNRH